MPVQVHVLLMMCTGLHDWAFNFKMCPELRYVVNRPLKGLKWTYFLSYLNTCECCHYEWTLVKLVSGPSIIWGWWLALIRFWSKSVKGQGHSEVKHPKKSYNSFVTWRNLRFCQVCWSVQFVSLFVCTSRSTGRISSRNVMELHQWTYWPPE